jgi:hypothetical protein
LVANLGGIHATIHAIATNNNLTSSSGLANKGLVRASGGKVAEGTIADVESASVSVITNRVIDSVSASSILGTSVVGARVIVLTVRGLKNTSSLGNLASNRCAHVGSGEVGAIIQSVDTHVSLWASWVAAILGTDILVVAIRDLNNASSVDTALGMARINSDTRLGNEVAGWGTSNIRATVVGASVVIIANVGGHGTVSSIANLGVANIGGLAKGVVLANTGETRINSAWVTIVAVKGGNQASLNGITVGKVTGIGGIARDGVVFANGSTGGTNARISCANIAVIASNWFSDTSVVLANLWVARIGQGTGNVAARQARVGSIVFADTQVAAIDCAWITIITVHWVVFASLAVHTRIDGAKIIVSAVDGDEITFARNGVTSVVGASVGVIANHCRVYATSERVARILGASKTIIATDGSIIASTISRIARIVGAFVVVIANNGGSEDARSVNGSASHRETEVGDHRCAIHFGAGDWVAALGAISDGLMFASSGGIARVGGTIILVVAAHGLVDTTALCITTVGSASVAIIARAGDVCVDTTLGSIASIRGTSVTVIAITGGMNATSGVAARIEGASVEVIAVDEGVEAALNLIARILSTGQVVIARSRSVSATTVGVARIYGTSVIVIASAGDVQVLASLGGITRILSTSVAVVARGGDKLATSGVGAAILGASIAVIATCQVVPATVDFVAEIVGALVAIIAVDGGVLATSGAVARVQGTGVAIVAIYFEVSATSKGTATIGGTGIIIVAINGLMGTTRFCGTRIQGTGVGVIAADGNVQATLDNVARILGAGIAIITVEGGVLATESGIARILGASVGIIAIGLDGVASGGLVAIGNIALVTRACDGAVETSGGVVATIIGASIGIIATNFRVLATTSNRGVVTILTCASIAIITRDVGVLAANVGRNQDGTLIQSARVGISASFNVGGGTARLSVTFTDIAPIVVCALNGNGGGNFDFRGDGVSLAIEEVETVVGTLGKSHIIDADGGRLFGVDTTNINHQTVVEVHPHIIITNETEEFTTLVGKTSVDFHAISEVVGFLVVTGIGVILETFAV